MNFYVLTLFPDMISGAVDHSILKRAASEKKISVVCIDIRDFADGKHRQADDSPYGGGAGMVMTAEPVSRACAHARDISGNAALVYLTPHGRRYDQIAAKKLSALGSVILLCGHYEGIDQRALDGAVDMEISMGDYILTGGELAALAVIDSVSRLIPGVLGKDESFENESFANGLLEYPQYTRPEVFRGVGVPEVLLSGHHKNIREWRRRQSVIITARKRPDLLAKAYLTKDEMEFIAKGDLTNGA